jgi:hypothetical protein
LDLQNVTALRGRAEVLEPHPHHQVVAQAVAPPAEVVGWMRRWAMVGGLLVIPASAELPRVPPIPGIEPLEPLSYRVPLGGPERLLWTARVSEPTLVR